MVMGAGGTKVQRAEMLLVGVQVLAEALPPQPGY